MFEKLIDICRKHNVLVTFGNGSYPDECVVTITTKDGVRHQRKFVAINCFDNFDKTLIEDLIPMLLNEIESVRKETKCV